MTIAAAERLINLLGGVLGDCLNLVYGYYDHQPSHVADFGDVVCTITPDYELELEIKVPCKDSRQFRACYVGNEERNEHFIYLPRVLTHASYRTRACSFAPTHTRRVRLKYGDMEHFVTLVGPHIRLIIPNPPF